MGHTVTEVKEYNVLSNREPHPVLFFVPRMTKTKTKAMATTATVANGYNVLNNKKTTRTPPLPQNFAVTVEHTLAHIIIMSKHTFDDGYIYIYGAFLCGAAFSILFV